MPLSLDVMSRVTNVQWGGKLAVEIDSPSLLEMSAPPSLDLSKATISLWFRVPQVVIDAALNDWKDRYYSDTETDFVFAGEAPLLVWGEKSTYDGKFKEGPSRISVSAVSMDLEYSLGSGKLQPNGKPSLVVKLMDNRSTIAGKNSYQIGVSARGVPYATDSGKWITISADAWHHLLLSYDCSSQNGKMYMALDDQNLSGGYFWPAATYNMGLFSVPPGGRQEITATFAWPDPLGFGPEWGGPGFNMALAKPLGVPNTVALAAYSGDEVEMAELQIFSGIMINTSNATTRSAFIAPKNAEDSRLSPVVPSKAEKLMGKKPEVMLHFQKNWQDGHNSGTLGVDNEGNDIQAGQFTVSGEIKKYEPEPSTEPGALE